MIAFILWYIILTFAGWLVFPLVFRLLRGLPDRGYSLSRIIALLLWGYVFWILTNFRILNNSSSSILFSLFIVAGLSIWLLYSKGASDMWGWIRDHRWLVLCVEGLFLLSFAFMTILRAMNPEALGTEKPMELAFINAILKSPTFPPNDPWLSGYAISYYHFGYILVAMLAKISGVQGSISFNLGISMIFALSAVGIYGLVYNLLKLVNPSLSRFNLYSLPLFGPLFLLAVSNFEGFLHMLHTRGLFWAQTATGEWVSPFWRWLDIKDLNLPPTQPFQWIPQQFWWWWRASRVLQDFDIAGSPREIIDEFPFFSYLLGDLHPHVLAMPFALLCVTLTLYVLIKENHQPGIGIGNLKIHISWQEFFLVALSCGAMGFLNTWDFPIYVACFSAGYAIREHLLREDDDPASWFWLALKNFVISGFFIGLAGFLLYLPFYLSFSSQASGLILNLVYPTRGAHLWVMFGTLFLPLLGYLGYLFINRKSISPDNDGNRSVVWIGILVALAVVIGLWLFSLVLGSLAMLTEGLRQYYLQSLGAETPTILLHEAFTRRLINFAGMFTLFIVLAVSFSIALVYLKKNGVPFKPSSKGILFSLLVVITGILLILVPEFFFLRDQFGWRMNTIFKFYYQAWILLSIAAAFGTAFMFIKIKGPLGYIFRIGLALVLFAGLVYPIISLSSKTNNFKISEWGLDGAAYLSAQNSGEAQAVSWLSQAPFGIIAEAVSPTGGSYTGFARISTLTGLPAVLGWMGHESQWRGGDEAMGNRQADIAALYCAKSVDQVRSVLSMYSIRYILVGSLERSTYTPGSKFCPGGLNEVLLKSLLIPVFQSGGTTVYEVPGM